MQALQLLLNSANVNIFIIVLSEKKPTQTHVKYPLKFDPNISVTKI